MCCTRWIRQRGASHAEVRRQRAQTRLHDTGEEQRATDQSEQSKSILLAAIRLAKQLGLQSIVEGIETQQYAARMAMLGADLIQGYWIGRPQLVRDAKAAIRLAS